MTCSRQIISGEMHYPRIPPEYWSARLAMARAMGFNAISTYVFWNRHEPREGVYDFSGENDVARFIQLAQQHDLDVILRPGPYVCAEWDFGGLPWWLLNHGDIGVRSTDERFMKPAWRWLRRLGEELAPLQRIHGGPIIAVQVENEYGAFGDDPLYLLQIRTALQDAGFAPSPLFTIDQPGDLARGALPDIPIAVTFAPGDPGSQFTAVHALRPQAPLLCGEYWAGWFDHWGEPHAHLEDEQQARDLQWMLSNGVSVNMYMFHGGTNFGFWNGANAFDPHPYQPTTTSYDYQAALDEAGRPTRKFWQFREVIALHTGVTADVPPAPETIEIPPFLLDEAAPLCTLLGEAIEAPDPLAMEELGQGYGFVLYRTLLSDAATAVLTIDELRDYAVIMHDGRVAGHLDRRLGETEMLLASERECATLDILVENCGRINYGPRFPAERKGITRSVRWNRTELKDWQIFPLPLETLDSLEWSNGTLNGPSFYRGHFYAGETADTFLDVRALRKGVVWVNGRNAGRFWEAGPQRSLYIPGVWLKRGMNEIIAFDLFGHASPPAVRGTTDPIYF